MKLSEKKYMNNKSILSRYAWIKEISSRFARIDRKGRSAVTSFLATAGICFGVMTLIVVMSVMNGFQFSFIDSVLELSSYHVQIVDNQNSFSEKLDALYYENKNILSVSPFLEAQTLMTSEYGKESAAIIRAVPPTIYDSDEGFAKEMMFRIGYFDLEDEDSIIIGSALARSLDVAIGDTVNLFVLSGSNNTDLFSSDRKFVVTGIFTSGYSEINSSYCYINIESGYKYFGQDAKTIYGIKLKNRENDAHVISEIKKQFPNVEVKSWRDYNKSFFGALRIEKNMMLLLVALIFVVVGINIYNGMRRLVFERRNEIAILSAVGARKKNIQSVFIMRGFLTGFTGAFFGLLLGLLICVNTETIFMAISKIMYFFQYIITFITNPESLMYLRENSTYAVYASIPAKIIYSEIVMIVLFGIISPLLASWAASKNIFKMTVAEVLHDE